jgi:hypothetical protein
MKAAASHCSAASERRRFKRAHFLFKGEVLADDEELGGHVLDLSVNGARFRFAGAGRAAAEMTLRLAGGVDFPVRTAWRRGNVAGLTFQDAPERISALFAGLLPSDCLAA